MARPVKLSTRDRRMARCRPPLQVRAIASSNQSNVYVDAARGLIATRSLPILIDDERRLTPALGYVFRFCRKVFEGPSRIGDYGLV